MKLHFSGISGIGISGLAQLCQQRGDEVSGSDLAKSEITPILEAHKIPVAYEQVAANIDDSIDRLIYSEAVPTNNPERVRARELGIPEQSYFSYLGEISAEFRTIAVAGTHGKTTTTGLISSGMKTADFPATVLMGSTHPQFGGNNFQAGNNEWLLVEACEYRDNFRFLSPEILVITSLEWDHIDSFPTEDSYFEAFARLAEKAKTVIYHRKDTVVKDRVLKNYRGKIIPINATEMDLSDQLQIFGTFNEENAALAVALAKELSLDETKFFTGLGNYAGAGRRQEKVGNRNGVEIYTDYAHHPTEIRVLLEAFKEKNPRKKIGIIFEPHQFSRTKQFFAEFLSALQIADKAAVFPIYEARDSEEDKQFRLDSFWETDPSIQFVDDRVSAEIFLDQFEPGDIVIFCGAGKIAEFAAEFLAKKLN